jgi:hypothetical protein
LDLRPFCFNSDLLPSSEQPPLGGLPRLRLSLFRYRQVLIVDGGFLASGVNQQDYPSPVRHIKTPVSHKKRFILANL